MCLVHSKIKKIRNDLNLTQKDFGKIISLSQGRLSEMENGATKPSFETLQSLAKAFDISPTYLVDDSYPITDISKIHNIEKPSFLPEKDSYIEHIIELFTSLNLNDQRYIEGLMQGLTHSSTMSKQKNVTSSNSPPQKKSNVS